MTRVLLVRDTDRCYCGHIRLWHRHYDKATDCTVCGCAAFVDEEQAMLRALAVVAFIIIAPVVLLIGWAIKRLLG